MISPTFMKKLPTEKHRFNPSFPQNMLLMSLLLVTSLKLVAIHFKCIVGEKTLDLESKELIEPL